MFRNKSFTRKIANKVKKASEFALDGLRQNRVEQEPAFTDRWLSLIEYELNGSSVGGVAWKAKTLTDRGRNSQESRYGADFLGVFDLSISGFSVQKGFMGQAKLVEPNDTFPNAESTRLKTQCDNMLNISPCSYIFLFSRMSGIQVIPAIAVLSARDCNPHELTEKSITNFFVDHFECFIGDRRISTAAIQDIDVLRHEFRARTMLYIGGKSLYGEELI